MERYAHYKPSGIDWIGDIPEGWGTCTFRRVLNICNGVDYKDIQVSEGGYPVYGSGGEFARCSSYLYNGEAVLLGRKGTIDRPIYVNGPFWTVDTMYYGVPKNNINVRYLWYFATCVDYGYYQYGSAVPSMTQRDLYGIPCLLPSADEQGAIADYLDEKTAKIDAVVGEIEESIAKLEEYRKSVISEAVTKGLDPTVPMKDSGIDWIGQIPADWDIRRLETVAERHSGHTPDKKVPEYWNDGSIVWVSLADSPRLRASKYIDDSNTKTNQQGIEHSSAEILPAGCVLLSRDASIGLTAIASKPLAVSQHFMAYVCGDSMCNEFLYYVFLAMNQELGKLSMGSTIPTIGVPLMKGLVIPLPDIVEQKAIIHHLNETIADIDRLIGFKHNQLGAMHKYRQSLISECVTGKVRVPGVEG